MIYDLKEKREYNNAIESLKTMREFNCMVKIDQVKKTRSNLQNSALHLFFTFISNDLNEMGMTYTCEFVKDVEVPYTPSLVKEVFWKPIQITLFEKESTTSITTSEMNTIIDVVVKFFADRGIEIHFPSKFNKYIDELNKLEKK